MEDPLRTPLKEFFLVSPTERERKHAFVQTQIEYCSIVVQVRFGVWTGHEYVLGRFQVRFHYFVRCKPRILPLESGPKVTDS